jgi:hypothetical protein
MDTTNQTPLGYCYDIGDIMAMAADEFPDAYDFMPSSNAISWIDVGADVGSKEFVGWAAYLGIVKDKLNGQYATVLGYLDCDGRVLISVRDSDMVVASLSILENTMWNPPFSFAVDEGTRSRNTRLKIESLVKYYFLEAGYTDAFTDPDGTYFKNLSLACVKMEENMSRKEARQRFSGMSKVKGPVKRRSADDDDEHEAVADHGGSASGTSSRGPTRSDCDSARTADSASGKRHKTLHEVRKMPIDRSAMPTKLTGFSSPLQVPTSMGAPTTLLKR